MQNPAPLVSIIVPCYNQAHFLPETLESVLAQTYPYWECIIINDGSTDHTGELAQRWLERDNRFRYLEKRNGGLSSARNAGLKIAKGEYIQLLDADDLLETEKIRHQLDFWRAGHGLDADILVSGYRYFYDNDPARKLFIYGPLNFLPEVAVDCRDQEDLVKLFSRTNPMVVSAPLYRKSVFQEIGSFDEGLGANEDWDFHFRCAVKGIVFQHCGYFPDAKTLIRIHVGSMSANRRNMIRNFRKFQQKHKEHPVFAVENDLVVKDICRLVLDVLKMLVPPVFTWIIKKILGYV